MKTTQTVSFNINIGDSVMNVQQVQFIHLVNVFSQWYWAMEKVEAARLWFMVCKKKEIKTVFFSLDFLIVNNFDDDYVCKSKLFRIKEIINFPSMFYSLIRKIHKNQFHCFPKNRELIKKIVLLIQNHIILRLQWNTK